MDVRPVCLEGDDAVELIELLEFVREWLGSDPGLGRSLRCFVGSDGYGVEELQADVARFAFLLGGDNDGTMFVPGESR